jgi:hypothetical protein
MEDRMGGRLGDFLHKRQGKEMCGGLLLTAIYLPFTADIDDCLAFRYKIQLFKKKKNK